MNNLKTGKRFFYKKFSLGLFLDTSISGFEQFLDVYEDYIENMYFSLPMGAKFHSRRRVAEQFRHKSEIEKFWKLLDILKKRGIKLELLFNKPDITDEEISLSHQMLLEHGIEPDLVGILDRYYTPVRKEFPNCDLVFSYNNYPHHHSDYNANGHHYEEYVIGRNMIRDRELLDHIHYNLNGKSILLVNNGCSFICGGCRDEEHCEKMHLTARKKQSAEEIYSLQSIMPFELHEGWIDLDQIDLIKINSRNSSLEYVRKCITSYIFGHEEEWISLSRQAFSLWAHLKWHFPYFQIFSYHRIRQLKIALYNNEKPLAKSRIRIYDGRHIECLYFSPYTQYKRSNDSILLLNTLYNSNVILKLDIYGQDVFLAMLERGCTSDDLLGFLARMNLGLGNFEEMLIGCIIE